MNERSDKQKRSQKNNKKAFEITFGDLANKFPKNETLFFFFFALEQNTRET